MKITVIVIVAKALENDEQEKYEYDVHKIN